MSGVAALRCPTPAEEAEIQIQNVYGFGTLLLQFGCPVLTVVTLAD
jgi:hypothetical protein